jgi:hypothetical protein
MGQVHVWRNSWLALTVLHCMVPATVALELHVPRRAVLRFGGLAALPLPAVAAAMDAAKARAQLEASARALDDLLERYDAVTAAEGGDGVRRVLGTVITKPPSPLYTLEGAAQFIAQESDEDPERAFEEVENLMTCISSADGEAYSSVIAQGLESDQQLSAYAATHHINLGPRLRQIFVPTGGGTTPEYWLARSKKEVVKVRASVTKILDFKLL